MILPVIGRFYGVGGSQWVDLFSLTLLVSLSVGRSYTVKGFLSLLKGDCSIKEIKRKYLCNLFRWLYGNPSPSNRGKHRVFNGKG